jgi:hypothetical protein
LDSADALIENTSDSNEEMTDTEEADAGAGAGAEVPPRKKRNSILPSQSDTPPLLTPMYTTQGFCPHLVFLNALSLSNAPSPSTSARPLPWPSSEEPCRLSHYLVKYDAERPR